MSMNPGSRMSSPVSLSATPSMISEVGGPQDTNPDGFKLPGIGPYGSGEPLSVSDPQTVIDLGDGDMELKVNNTIFKTHKHLLNDFSRLKEMIKGMERCNPTSHPCVSVYRDEHGVEDFRNMFKILYASLIKGPFEFDSTVLISALRIAAAYDYPELRAFSIERLQTQSLSPVQRIELAREFNLTDWEHVAFHELVAREEAITKDEALALGIDKMEEISKAREEEKKKRGKEERIEEEKREAEERRVAEERSKKEEEERIKRKEEERLKREAEERAKKEEEERARKEAEERAQKEAEERANREAEERAKKEAEEKAS